MPVRTGVVLGSERSSSQVLEVLGAGVFDESPSITHRDRCIGLAIRITLVDNSPEQRVLGSP